MVIDSDNDDDVYSPTITYTPAILVNARDVRAHAETAPGDTSYAEMTPEPRQQSCLKQMAAHLDVYELAK